jgi:DNA-binding transcriptional LysR family regulator
MNTRQLEHFLAVLDAGTLAAAADTVHLSVPALSRSLRALEDALSAPLFDRSERRLRPTPYAHHLADRARRILSEEREARRSLLVIRDARGGLLRFGMGPSIAQGLLAPLCLALMEAAPGVRLEPLVQSSLALFEAFQREQLDFFVGDVRVAAAQADLKVEPLHACRFAWYARSGHPLARRRRLGMADLAAYPLIHAGQADPAIGLRFAELYGLEQPFAQMCAVNTGDTTAVCALLEGSDSIAPLSDVAAMVLVRQGRLRPLQVDPPLDLPLTLGLVLHARRTLPPVSELAFDHIRAFFAQARGPGAVIGPGPAPRARSLAATPKVRVRKPA